jgi:hypothetical protein
VAHDVLPFQFRSFTQPLDFSFNHGVRRVLLRFYQKSGSFQGQKCNNASLTPSEINQSRKLSHLLNLLSWLTLFIITEIRKWYHFIGL